MSRAAGSRRPVPRRGRVLLWLAPAGAVLLLAVVGPLLPTARQSGAVPFAAPGDPGAGGAVLGTDVLGRDVLAQVLDGGRAVVVLPLLAALLACALGTAAGLLLGWFDGRGSRATTRGLELLLGLPPVLVLLTVLYGLGTGPWQMLALVIATALPFTARLVAAAVRPLRQAGFVEAALAMGDPPRVVLRREVLPLVVPTLAADLGLRVAGSVYLVAAAAVLGFGSAPPATDWATQIQQNLEGAMLNPWATVVPVALIAVFAISVNLGLDALSHRLGAGQEAT